MAKQNKNNKGLEDQIDSMTYSLGRLFGIDMDSEKEYKEKLNKMTKEQLINEVLIKDAELKKALRDRANDNEIAKAIKEGMQQVAFSNSQSGLTVDKSFVDTAMSKVTMETTESTNNKIRAERERMSTAYRFIQELEKYKAVQNREMFSDISKFININPYDMSAEYLEQMIDVMHKDVDMQDIFNYGWNQALSKILIDKRREKKAKSLVVLPKHREVRVTAEIK